MHPDSLAYKQCVYNAHPPFVCPEFMELMEFRFQDKARRNGCFVVSAAGFDSIPADLGVLYTMQQFQAPAVPSSVTSFLAFEIGDAGMCGKHVKICLCSDTSLMSHSGSSATIQPFLSCAAYTSCNLAGAKRL